MADSNVKIGLRFLDSILIKHNKTQLVIGEIVLIKTKYKNLERNFRKAISVIGLNSYYKHQKITETPRVKLF